MAIGRKGAVSRHLQTIFGAGTVAGLTDAQLLERFAGRGDAVAFEALVARHGPLVLGVCRNVLRDVHAAEDAFQATFLVLARRAGLIRKRESLAPWLHGVAYRVSIRARADSSRRRSLERQAAEAVRADPSEGIDLDSRSAIHEEVQRLPERYRAAIVLCYFEGLTHDEAAHRLGWPVGTVRGRLARARDLLRGRLIRRGLAPTAGVLGAASCRSTARAAVPASLETSTIRAAMRIAAGEALTAEACSATVAALTRGVLRTMILTRFKLAGAVLLIAGFATTGAGVLARQAGDRGDHSASAESSESKPSPPASAAREETTARSGEESSAPRRNDERLTKIEEALQALKKQTEVVYNETLNTRQVRKGNAGAGLLSSEELEKGIQEIQGHRAEQMAKISEELELAKAQVEGLRAQLSKAEQFASELQRLHDDLSGNRSLRPSIIPVIRTPTLPVPQPAPPAAVSQPIQPAPPAPEMGVDQYRDRRLDRLERQIQRLLELQGSSKPSTRDD